MRPFCLRAAVSAVLALAASLAGTVMAQPAETHRLVIAHVGIIDTRTGKVLEDRDVVIRGDRIISVEPVGSNRWEADTILLDGSGKYLIPGLWDCHVHLSLTTDSALPLFDGAHLGT